MALHIHSSFRRGDFFSVVLQGLVYFLDQFSPVGEKNSIKLTSSGFALTNSSSLFRAISQAFSNYRANMVSVTHQNKKLPL